MDRKYYYRILGLQEGASAQDIKKAYNLRMERLRSADYADDPEYVAKKVAQAKYAYSVLMGSAAPMTKAQRKENYECYKDDIEDNRDSDHFIEKHGRKIKRLNASAAAADAKRAFQTIIDSGETLAGGSKKSGRRKTSTSGMAKLVLIIIFTVILSIVSVIGAIFDNMSFQQAIPEDSYVENAYREQNVEAVLRILGRSGEYDFFGYLDGAEKVPDDKIEWDITEETETQLWSLNSGLAYGLGIYDMSYAVEFLSGDEDEYWENSDYENGQWLIDIMGAPAFKEVAGLTNMYNNEPVLDYEDYMMFLTCVAEDQTEELCGPEVEYY